MKEIKIFFFVLFPCFVYSQQWLAYSDSVISNIKKSDYAKASYFIDLADENIEKYSITRDTLYADYIYRKGVVNYHLGKFDNVFFDSALSIWEHNTVKNYSKIMKIYYYLGVGYHFKLDYTNAYENYEKCYLINKKYKLPVNINFTNSIYYLSVIDYNTNKDLKKAKLYAQEYIQYNKQIALTNYDFNYAYAYYWMDDLKGFQSVLLDFEKKYLESQLENPKLYFKINYELFTLYYKLNDINQIIKYGEIAIKLYQIAEIDNQNYLKNLYPKLAWAYSEIYDSVNFEKYRQLNDKYFKINNASDYLIDLDRLDRAQDYYNFKIKFYEYEELYKKGKNYNLLFYLYAYYLINLYEREIIFTREDIINRIDYVDLINEHLSNDERIDFDLFKAEFYKLDKQYIKAIDICNKNIDIDKTKRKLSFYSIKSWCQNFLGDIRNAKLTAYEAYDIGNKEYGYNNPMMLPLINDVLNFNYIVNDQNSTKIVVHALNLLYNNNLIDTNIAIRTWLLLGNYSLFYNNYADAKKYYEKSIEIQEKKINIQFENDYLLCLRNLGLLKSKELDFEGAIFYLNKVKLFLDNNPSIDKSHYGDYYNSLGDYYMGKLQYQEAIINYEKSFSMLGYEESKKNNFNYIVCDFFIKKDVNKTISELELFQKNNYEINHVSNLIYLLKFNTENIDIAQNYLVNQLNKLIYDNNKYFHLLSDYEREILFKKINEQFEFLNFYLLNNDQSFINQYVYFRFYIKSLLFSHSFNLSSDIGIDNELYYELKNNTISINKILESKTSNEKSIEDLKNRNREIEKVLLSSTKSLKIPTIKNLDEKLKYGEAYVEIIRINKQSRNFNKSAFEIPTEIFTDSISYGAIIIKKNSEPKFILIDDNNQLEKQYASSFKSKIQSKQEDLESYHLLFEIIDNELKDIKKIYLVTDGVYNSINIESIYNPNKKQHLIDYLKIQQIQSVRAIIEEKKEFKVGSTSKAVLFGNPDFDLLITDSKIEEFSLNRGLDKPLLDEIKSGVKISRLNGTQKEIEALDTILRDSKSSVTIYSNITATEDNLKNVQSPDILHIASHGYFLKNDDTSKTKQSIANLINDNYKNDSYLKSGLLLAGAQNTLNGKQPENSNNGILTAEEAKSLILKDTELVVLSACETGLGVNLVGEGVIGLQRAFMIAGAKSVIMSLWSVSDEKTQELMTLFYTNWIKNNMSKEEALYQAKIEMKKLYSQPYYWAGFVLLE